MKQRSIRLAGQQLHETTFAQAFPWAVETPLGGIFHGEPNKEHQTDQQRMG